MSKGQQKSRITYNNNNEKMFTVYKLGEKTLFKNPPIELFYYDIMNREFLLINVSTVSIFRVNDVTLVNTVYGNEPRINFHQIKNNS